MLWNLTSIFERIFSTGEGKIVPFGSSPAKPDQKAKGASRRNNTKKKKRYWLTHLSQSSFYVVHRILTVQLMNKKTVERNYFLLEYRKLALLVGNYSLRFHSLPERVSARNDDESDVHHLYLSKERNATEFQNTTFFVLKILRIGYVQNL